MDPALILYDNSGRELERNRSGGLLDFTAAADGDYLLKVHDFLFRGGPEYFYHLSIHTGPHLDFIFPPAGQPGTKGKYTLYGRNLGARPPSGAVTPEFANIGSDVKIEGKILEQLEVEIELPPADENLDTISISSGCAFRRPDVSGFEYRLQTPNGFSNPFLIS